MKLVDNDKLLKDFGEPVISYRTEGNEGFVTIKHAIPVGKRNVQFINIQEMYNPFNSWDKHDALERAKRKYRKVYYKIESVNYD